MPNDFEIGFSAESNLPGVYQCKVIAIEDVVRVLTPDKNLATLEHSVEDKWVELMTGAKLSKLWFAEKTGNYTEEKIESEHGEAWKCEFSIKVAGDSPNKRLKLSRLSNRKFLAVFRDNNGAVRMMGLPEFPAKASLSFTTVDFKGWVLKFEVVMLQPAYFVQSWSDLQIFGQEFSDEFSDEFNV